MTPATRLTWRELLEPASGAEDETNTSPNDRLLWDNHQDTLYLSALSPMMSRKGRKRARSSSPVSSPAPEKPNPPSVNVKKLTQALKSPHADPTLELWDRYSLNGAENATTPLGIAHPALAQLMVSSSPRSTKGSNAEANLRRAISCGLNWPKRRRVERSTSGSRSGEKEDPEAASKSSLVTALLDTVTSSINEQSAGSRDELPESPSPKKRRICATSSGSPRQKKVQLPESSDYGDDDLDDFDDDTLMQLEASISATQLGAQVDQEKTIPQESKKEVPQVSDEFDDLDDDIFDEAENLIASAESRHTSQVVGGNRTPQKPTTAPVGAGEDDEFEDAFEGDFDFEAVELAATQAVKQSPSSGDVRGRI